MGRLQRLRKLRGPKSRIERFLTWKKGPISTECLAYFLIVVLVYVNLQMILAIYAEKNFINEEESNFHIKLEENPIAEDEARARQGLPPKSQEDVDVALSKNMERKTGISGDPIIETLCPTEVRCPSDHVHIYAESGPRKTKICLNGKEAMPAWKTGRGINIVVINPKRGTAGSSYNYDTYKNPGTDMVDIINEMNDGRLVVMTVQDEASAKLGAEAKLAIERLGSTLIHTISWRSTWVFIGQVGITTVSQYEAIQRPVDDSTWPDPTAISQCVPYELDDRTILSEYHTEFCERYDNYGSFCKSSWTKPKPALPLPQYPITTANTFPIAIISGNRGNYLRQVIASLLAAPGVDPNLIIVFQDGYGEETFEVVRQFGVRLVRFPKTDSNVHDADTFNQADHIASNYKRSLDTVWDMYWDKDYVYVVEDDLLISPDFFSYYQQLLPVLMNDQTIFTASCWNDNGYRHSSSDPNLIYRSEFFPGLGWILSRKHWVKLLKPAWPKCCNGYSWDLYLRDVLKQQGYDCLYPDLSRTFHIGKSGANVFNEFYNGYFREKVYTKEPYYELANLDKLTYESYNALLRDLVAHATPVDHTMNPCDQHFIQPGTKTLVLYYFQRKPTESRQAMAIAGCLRIWNVDKVRGMFSNVLRTSYRGNHLLVVGSLTPLAKEYMGSEIVPFKIAPYKDEIKEKES